MLEPTSKRRNIQTMCAFPLLSRALIYALRRPPTLVIFDNADIGSVSFVRRPPPLAHVFSLISRVLKAKADVATLIEQRHLNANISDQPRKVAGRLASPTRHIFCAYCVFSVQKACARSHRATTKTQAVESSAFCVYYYRAIRT